jgi:hypothetical protein
MGFRSLRKQLPPPVPSEQPARKWSTSCFSPPYRKARLPQPMCVFNQPLRLTLPSQLPVSRVLSAPIGDSLGLSAWRAMPMPKPLPPFRSRCSGCRLSWLLSSIYQPSDGDHGSSHGGRLQQCVALESGHVICMLRHDTHHQYIPGYAIEDQLPMVENWLRGRRDSSWSGRSSIDAKIAVDFDITDDQARVAESRVSV